MDKNDRLYLYRDHPGEENLPPTTTLKAGRSNIDVDTHVRVTLIASNDPDDTSLVGVTGRITHPFPGLMHGSPNKYLAGLWVDEEFQSTHGKEVNLLINDCVEPLTPSESP